MAVLHLALFCGEKGEPGRGGVFLRAVFVKWGGGGEGGQGFECGVCGGDRPAGAAS